MLPSQRRKGNKSIGILLQLILSSLHFPTSQHDLSAEEGKNLSASKFVCIKDLVSGPILLQAVDKLQLLRIFNKLNMVIQKAYLHITTHQILLDNQSSDIYPVMSVLSNLFCFIQTETFRIYLCYKSLHTLLSLFSITKILY